MAGCTQKARTQRWPWCRWSGLQKWLRLGRDAFAVSLIAGLLAHTAGCTRHYYRKQADEDVSEILAQKDKYPDWAIDNWHVYPDPRARFADPTNPDRPPKPPDDPAAYAMSPNPQEPCKAGIERIEGTGYLELIAQWDKENRERQAKEAAEENDSAEPPPVNPDANQGSATMPPPGHQDVIVEAKSRTALDMSGRPAYLLTLDQAAELAMFNSREFQDQREELYLAALPVTTERFSFMGQFFAASEAARNYTTGGAANNWTVNNDIGVSKVLPTGALLLANFANQTVFNFVNPKGTTNLTTLDFSAVQPLLQGGGQAVALETLTDAERALLYAMRNYARFRKSLYVEIASNNGGAISGSAFQPSGVLSSGANLPTVSLGSSGLTPGLPPPNLTSLTGPQVAPFIPGFLALSPALTPPPSGYLNTMLQTIQVYIDQENIDVLCVILNRFRGLLEGDQVQPLQVQNVEQQLLTGRNQLLIDQQNVPQALNAFKIEIGVPMGLDIQMDDSVLRPLVKQFHRARSIIDDEQTAVAQATTQIPLEKAPGLRVELLRLFEKSRLVKGTQFGRQIRGQLATWEKLTDKELEERIKKLEDETQKLQDQRDELTRKNQYLSPADEARLKEAISQRDQGKYERNLRRYESKYVDKGQPKKPADEAGERQRRRDFQDVIYTWQKVLVDARDERWLAVDSSWAELPRCCVDGVDLIHEELKHAEQTAAQHALNNRLDLMNSRGLVVDAWRQIAIYANALLGVFNVQYNGSFSAISGSGGTGSSQTHQLVLNTQLPLTRIQQRNNYRAAQIAYQRQRRALQEAEDLAIEAVDNELTNLRQAAEQYKIQQRQLKLAYLTIDSSLESLEAPVAPQLPAGLPARGASDGPAALTQQLLTAQRSLPAAQTALLTVWISYFDQRLQLYRDLELMPLDARGVWIDQIRDCDCGIVSPEQGSGSAVPQGSASGVVPTNGASLSPPTADSVSKGSGSNVAPDSDVKFLPCPSK